MVNLAQNLKRERATAGLTQEALATKSGVSRSTIAVLESATRTDTTAETLAKLAGALGVDVGKLVAPRRPKRSRGGGRRAANSD